MNSLSCLSSSSVFLVKCRHRCYRVTEISDKAVFGNELVLHVGVHIFNFDGFGDEMDGDRIIGFF